MYLDEVVKNCLMSQLTEEWTNRGEDWKIQFVTHFASCWYRNPKDCFQQIGNQSNVYADMVYFVSHYTTDYQGTVDLFNSYIFFYGLMLMHEDCSMLACIRNIHRIKLVRGFLPRILDRLPVPDAMVGHIRDYVEPLY